MRRLLLALACLSSALPVFAQPPRVGINPASLSAPVVVFPASGVNGSGTATVVPVTIPVNGLGTTSTDGLILVNQTLATNAVKVQISPRLFWQGTAWDNSASETVGFFAEVLPATAATPTGTWKLGYSLNGGGATYPLTVTSAGAVTALGTITSSLNIIAGISQVVGFASRSGIDSAADKLLAVRDNGFSTGMELNVGTPTLGTCTGGTLVSGSHNFGGEVTGNTSGSCIINFGTPNFTNAPFCFTNDEASLTQLRVSARSASSITVTGAPSGEAFQFFCIGRIGT